MSKNDKTMLSDAALDEIFAAGREATPAPSDAVLARILADAEGEIEARAAPVRRPAMAERPGLWARILSGLGGWPAVAGMATATVAGVWLGFASPDQLNELAGGLLLPEASGLTSYDLEDFLPSDGGFSALFEEG